MESTNTLLLTRAIRCRGAGGYSVLVPYLELNVSILVYLYVQPFKFIKWQV